MAKNVRTAADGSGSLYVNELTEDQKELVRNLKRNDSLTLAYLVLLRMTEEEQAEMLRIHRMCKR